MKALHETRAAVCSTPSQVDGVRFYPGGSYETVYRQNFLCSKKRYIFNKFKVNRSRCKSNLRQIPTYTKSVSLKIKLLKVTACRKLSFASLQLPNLRTFCNLYGAFYFFRLTSPTFYFKWFDVVVCFNCFYMATHKATAFDKSNFRQIAKSSSSHIMNLYYFRPCQCLGIDPRWFSAECHVGQT